MVIRCVTTKTTSTITSIRSWTRSSGGGPALLAVLLAHLWLLSPQAELQVLATLQPVVRQGG